MNLIEFWEVMGNVNWSFILGFTVLMFFVALLRYSFFAGTIFYVCSIFKKDKWARFRVIKPFAAKKRVITEIKWSFISSLIFGAMETGLVVCNGFGLTKLYRNISDFGWLYFFGSIFVMIVIQDAYFYWIHRIIHWKPLFKPVHRVHHQSVTTTPFTSYSFSPIEAAAQFAVIPMIAFIMPFHWLSLAIFLGIMNLHNVIQHNNYEFWPRIMVTNKYLNWICTPTHHSIHHTKLNYHYGLYFNFWDRIMGTQHPKYQEMFEEVKDRSDVPFEAPVEETYAAAARG